jgi:predicted PurR-regulated permease PerM
MSILNLIIIPVIGFYLLKDFNAIKEEIKNYIPSSYRDSIINRLKEIDYVLSGFIRGQLIVSSILTIIYIIGLSIFNIPIALLIAIIAGIANIVPYFGFIIGITPAILLAILEYHDLEHIIGVIGTFAIAQLLEATIITPKIMREKIGIHPVTVILAILIWGNLFGFWGILIAVPLTSILNIFFKDLLRYYKNIWVKEVK